MADSDEGRSAMGKISGDSLQCAICTNHFTDPKMLDCLHSFCLKCLQELNAQLDPETTRLVCPTCRYETTLCVKGVPGLPDNPTLSILVAEARGQGSEMECQARSDEISTTSVEESDAPICETHADQNVCIYCDTCLKMVCKTCITEDHSQHSLISLSEALDRCKRQHQELVAKAEQRKEQLMEAMRGTAITREKLELEHAKTIAKITKRANKKVEQITEGVRKEEQKIKHEVEKVYKAQAATLEISKASNKKKRGNRQK